MQMSEKMLRRAASAKESGEAHAFHPSEMEAIYNSAVTGIRELGKAVADAQIRSIETLRAHARNASQKPASGDGAPRRRRRNGRHENGTGKPRKSGWAGIG